MSIIDCRNCNCYRAVCAMGQVIKTQSTFVVVVHDVESRCRTVCSVHVNITVSVCYGTDIQS